MIFWTLHKKDDQESSTVELKPERKYQLKESDHVQFQVEVSNDKLGKPTIIIGDIPIELELSHSNENSLVFITPYSVSENNSRYFYNFFGESEVSLYFENTIDLALTVKFDILAQPRNALLANEMLDYLTNNVEDAIAICFSRSKQGVSLTEDHKFSFSKIHIIVEAVEFITSHLPVFNREHKSILIPNLTLSQQGQPTGPDSVFWALSNLDKISPSSTEESNLVFNNKAYRFDELPKENLISNTDVFENRVINSFLQYVSQFLLSLGGVKNITLSAIIKSFRQWRIIFD